MEHMDDIIRSREIIKRKYNALRRGEAEESLKLEKVFKPVAEPLKAVLRLKTRPGYDRRKVFGPVKKEEKVEVKTDEVIPKDEFEPERTEDGDNVDYNEDDEGDASEDGEEEKEDADSSNTTTTMTVDTYVTRFGPLVAPYFRLMHKSSGKNNTVFDHTFGVRHGGGTIAEWMIGNKAVSFDKDDTLYVQGEPFVRMTPGLCELIFKRSPKGYDPEDLFKYKELLELTSAHKRSYDPSKPLKYSRAIKYTRIIKPLFSIKAIAKTPPSKVKQKKKVTTAAEPRGSGMFVPTQKREYVFWDDPNELVERLALLVASRDAGNTGVQREILSIEEELREAGYIL